MPVFRDSGISYIRIPADDPKRTAQFYADVFGWTVDLDRADPSFSDGTGDVIGHFRADLEPAGEAGFQPYVYVERLDETLEKAIAHGGTVTTDPDPEGDLRVAVVRDPAGNLVGVWTRA